MIKKTLVISLLGIGNNIFVLPMLKKLKMSLPYNDIDVLLGSKNILDIYQGFSFLSNIYHLPDIKIRNFFKFLKLMFYLRKKKYDLSITTFPSNKIVFNIIAKMINSKIKISNQYSTRNFFKLHFFQNIKVPSQFSVHDYIQNLNLLAPLGIVFRNDDFFLDDYISKKYLKDIKLFFRKNKIFKKHIIIGIHPGSSFIRGMYSKRWPAGNYIKLIKKTNENFKNIKILIFGDKNEYILKSKIFMAIKKNIIIVNNKQLGFNLALIKYCNIFIGNDSGLIKMATLHNIRTISLLMGAADPDRTMVPDNPHHQYVLAKTDCYPCMDIFNTGKRFKCNYNQIKCQKTITVEEVYQVFLRTMKSVKRGKNIEK